MPKRKPKRLSDQIRTALDRSEKSRYRISKETGIDAGALCNFLQGKRGLSLDTLDVLAECLGLRIVVEGDVEKKRSGRKAKGR